MRISFLALFSLLPFLNVSGSLADWFRILPVELRDETYQKLPLSSLTIVHQELRVAYPDIRPTEHLMIKSTLEGAEAIGRKLSVQFISDKESVNDVAAALGELALNFDTEKDVSSFEKLLLELSLDEKDYRTIGVVAAIASSDQVINAFLHLSPDFKDKMMPLVLKIVNTYKLDTIVTV